MQDDQGESIRELDYDVFGSLVEVRLLESMSTVSYTNDYAGRHVEGTLKNDDEPTSVHQYVWGDSLKIEAELEDGEWGRVTLFSDGETTQEGDSIEFSTRPIPHGFAGDLFCCCSLLRAEESSPEMAQMLYPAEKSSKVRPGLSRSPI